MLFNYNKTRKIRSKRYGNCIDTDTSSSGTEIWVETQNKGLKNNKVGIYLIILGFIHRDTPCYMK